MTLHKGTSSVFAFLFRALDELEQPLPHAQKMRLFKHILKHNRQLVEVYRSEAQRLEALREILEHYLENDIHASGRLH